MTTAYSGDGITFPDESVQATAPRVGMVNRIINGDMRVSQRNGGASVTISNTGAITYTLDRWAAYGNVASKFSVQQNAGSVTPPVGFSNYLGATSLSAYSVTAPDGFSIRQSVEGFNVADLNWGTANAQAVTLSFKVRSSLTGTFGGVIRNGDATRSYPFTYTISSANTWTTANLTIAGDTSGTWLTTNGRGLVVLFSLGAGSGNSGTADAWVSTAYESATGATSVVGTSGATFYVTGVQLEKGSTATDFEYVDYGRQLQMCQRYYEWGVASGSGYAAITAIFDAGSTSNIDFKVSKRVVPTMTNMTLSGNQYPNNQSNSVPRYENGYSRGFRHTTEHNTTFWNVTSGNGGSTGVAGHQIIWNASAEL